jgi:hypothetical protein
MLVTAVDLVKKIIVGGDGAADLRGRVENMSSSFNLKFVHLLVTTRL